MKRFERCTQKLSTAVQTRAACDRLTHFFICSIPSAFRYLRTVLSSAQKASLSKISPPRVIHPGKTCSRCFASRPRGVSAQALHMTVKLPRSQRLPPSALAFALHRSISAPFQALYRRHGRHRRLCTAGTGRGPGPFRAPPAAAPRGCISLSQWPSVECVATAFTRRQGGAHAAPRLHARRRLSAGRDRGDASTPRAEAAWLEGEGVFVRVLRPPRLDHAQRRGEPTVRGRSG